MTFVTPLAAIPALVEARNNADVDTALYCYDTDVTVVAAQPGLVLTGLDGARAALEGFIALTPTFTVHARQILPTGQLALHYSRWTLIGTTPDGQPVELSGRSTDVLRHGRPLWSLSRLAHGPGGANPTAAGAWSSTTPTASTFSPDREPQTYRFHARTSLQRRAGRHHW